MTLQTLKAILNMLSSVIHMSKSKDKIETVKTTAKAISELDTRLSGQTVGEAIKDQVKTVHPDQ